MIYFIAGRMYRVPSGSSAGCLLAFVSFFFDSTLLGFSAGGGKLVERITGKSLCVEWDVIGGRILFS